MFGKRKKSKGEQVDAAARYERPGIFDTGEMVSAEKAIRSARSHILFFALLFAGLFGWMCFYFTSSALEDRVKLFNNDYSKRDELLETRNGLGSIYASDSETEEAVWRSIISMIFCIRICRCRTKSAMTAGKMRTRGSIRATM